MRLHTSSARRTLCAASSWIGRPSRDPSSASSLRKQSGTGTGTSRYAVRLKKCVGTSGGYQAERKAGPFLRAQSLAVSGSSPNRVAQVRRRTLAQERCESPTSVPIRRHRTPYELRFGSSVRALGSPGLLGGSSRPPSVTPCATCPESQPWCFGLAQRCVPRWVRSAWRVRWQLLASARSRLRAQIRGAEQRSPAPSPVAQ